MATASDVPGKYDLVLNSKGYLFLDALTPNIPFRTHRAIYSYSPTFLERTNVGQGYGDDQQSFWLTASQNDWTLGEEQHFFRTNDAQSVRRYWKGSNIDVSTEGQAKLMGAATSITFAAAVGGTVAGNQIPYTVSTSNLYSVDGAGNITDHGAHGTTISAVSIAALAWDGHNLFISGDGAAIRKWNGSTYSDFSGTIASSLCFVDNTLWGANNSVLSYYDTGGTAHTAFSWNDASGSSSVQYGQGLQIVPFGGKVLVLRPGVGVAPAELWTADTSGASQIAALPEGFSPRAVKVVNGIVFVVGTYLKKNYGYRTELWYYANGNIGKAYSGSTFAASSGSGLAICEWENGLVFSDGPNGRLLHYNLVDGGVSTIATYTQPATSKRLWIACNSSGLLVTNDSTGGTVVPTASAATSGYVQTSLFDFDSSLTKVFRGIIVEFDSATDGDGGSVDIAYRVGDVDGSYTTLQTGATTGTEYTFGAVVSGRNISVKVTLNKGTSTNGPVLKRIYVRAAPRLQQYRKREYILDLTGAPPDAPRLNRDGSPYTTIPFDGVTDLVSAATSTSPISITDRLGTFTGIIEPDGFEVYEMHAQQQIPSKSGSYVVKVTVREV